VAIDRADVLDRERRKLYAPPSTVPLGVKFLSLVEKTESQATFASTARMTLSRDCTERGVLRYVTASCRA
jgi:hypothetical protein